VLPQHWRCCDKGEGTRLFEADSLIGFLKDAFTPKGNFSFESEPPFLVIGDLNLVVTRRPLDVVLTGVVVDKDSYGPDFPPGPDRTPLTVVPIRHAEAPFTHTWHSSGTKYYSARLDWALIPSSVEVLRSFVFDTGTMFGATLQELELSRRDGRIASDHMPIVVDVRW
jgi:endonuclease/exonuclease/phosphatase family metal-dependent hydrolase